MRCFVAIDLPQEIKDELSKIQSALPKADMRLVEKKNLHITLAFLGEIDNSKLEICARILNELNFKKFNAYLGRIGFFPSQDYIRVVWVSVEPSEELKRIYSQIYNKIKGEFLIDNRFESHVTLARINFIENKQDFVRKILSSNTTEQVFEIDSFALKKSTLTREGPIYEDVKRFQMT